MTRRLLDHNGIWHVVSADVEHTACGVYAPVWGSQRLKKTLATCLWCVARVPKFA